MFPTPTNENSPCTSKSLITLARYAEKSTSTKSNKYANLKSTCLNIEIQSSYESVGDPLPTALTDRSQICIAQESGPKWVLI